MVLSMPWQFSDTRACVHREQLLTCHIHPATAGTWVTAINLRLPSFIFAEVGS